MRSSGCILIILVVASLLFSELAFCGKARKLKKVQPFFLASMMGLEEALDKMGIMHNGVNLQRVLEKVIKEIQNEQRQPTMKDASVQVSMVEPSQDASMQTESSPFNDVCSQAEPGFELIPFTLQLGRTLLRIAHLPRPSARQLKVFYAPLILGSGCAYMISKLLESGGISLEPMNFTQLEICSLDERPVDLEVGDTTHSMLGSAEDSLPDILAAIQSSEQIYNNSMTEPTEVDADIASAGIDSDDLSSDPPFFSAGIYYTDSSEGDAPTFPPNQEQPTFTDEQKGSGWYDVLRKGGVLFSSFIAITPCLYSEFHQRFTMSQVKQGRLKKALRQHKNKRLLIWPLCITAASFAATITDSLFYYAMSDKSESSRQPPPTTNFAENSRPSSSHNTVRARREEEITIIEDKESFDEEFEYESNSPEWESDIQTVLTERHSLLQEVNVNETLYLPGGSFGLGCEVEAGCVVIALLLAFDHLPESFADIRVKLFASGVTGGFYHTACNSSSYVNIGSDTKDEILQSKESNAIWIIFTQATFGFFSGLSVFNYAFGDIEEPGQLKLDVFKSMCLSSFVYWIIGSMFSHSGMTSDHE